MTKAHEPERYKPDPVKKVESPKAEDSVKKAKGLDLAHFDLQLSFPGINPSVKYKELFLFIDSEPVDDPPIYKSYMTDIMQDNIGVDLANNMYIELLHVSDPDDPITQDQSYHLFLERDLSNPDHLVTRHPSAISFIQLNDRALPPSMEKEKESEKKKSKSKSKSKSKK